MGIERPDDDDAPAVDRDPRQVGGDSPALERELPGEYELSGERELPVGQYSGADLEAERERYRVEYPAKVGAAYRAAWDEAVPTQRYGYAFGRNTDYCGLFGATASGPMGPARNATATLPNSSTGTNNKINIPIG